MRDDFSREVVASAKLRAAYICANPSCRKFTIAPSVVDDMLVQYDGKVAHITAAAIGGPRYDAKLSESERKGISNSIFLCSNCADIIDKNNGVDYSIELLRTWKEAHYRWVLKNLNKSANGKLKTIISSNHQTGGITANIVNIHTSEAEKIDKKKTHDIDLYLRAEKIFDEDFIHKFYENINSDANCQFDDIHHFDQITRFFEKASNCFLSSDLDFSAKAFAETIEPLTSFIQIHFDKWPYDQQTSNFNIQLHPDYLRDTRYKPMKWEDRELWHVLFTELKGYSDAMFNSYQKFRMAIKHELLL